MKKRTIFLRSLSLSLIVIFILPLLVSCKGRELAQSSLAKKEVGTVGDYTVQYEEFYFVANNYYNTMKAQYKNDPDGLKKAVWEKTVEHLASYYYAILTLCKAEGIEYDEKSLKSEIDDYVEKQIEANFGGSRSDYIESQKQVGLTDHYVRFTIGVDLMYSKLLTKYQESGVVPNTDEKITKYIKENLIHTWHLAVVVNKGDDRAKKLEKAESLLKRLNDGESFYSLIKYSEDYPSYMSGVDGTYFHKGEMTKEYEDASLALRVNDYSGIVTSTAKQSDGSMLECFYIIQRLPVKDSEIQENFAALSDKISSAIVAEKVQAIQGSLSFKPNDYAKSLDVTNLEQPKNGVDYQVILVIVACALSVAIIITLIVISKKLKLKKFNQLKQQRQIKRKN